MKTLVLFLVAAAVAAARAADPEVPWVIKDAPYRAVIKTTLEPEDSAMGYAIEVPEFGQTREDLTDLYLSDAEGTAIAWVPVRRVAGDRLLIVAQSLAPRKQYYLYFGGDKTRASLEAWSPKLSLLMETRPISGRKSFEKWEELREAWKQAGPADGIAFVRKIYHGENPFGESPQFLTRYTGYLKTPEGGKVFLYTLSSDASFVLVNERLAFGWPGNHSPVATANTVTGAEVETSPGLTRIDYYHAKTAGGPPAMVLGWRRPGGKQLEAIPPEVWVHAGNTELVRIEESGGEAGPVPTFEPLSYIGYSGQWFYEVRFKLAEPPPEGASVEWRFEDGAVVSGTGGLRIVTSAQNVTLRCSRARIGRDATPGTGVATTYRRLEFLQQPIRRSVNNPLELAHYLERIGSEKPVDLSEPALAAYLALLRDFGDDRTFSAFAAAWLERQPAPKHPLWFDAQMARLRGIAREDPRAAIEALRSVEAQANAKQREALSLFELDLIVFRITDPDGVGRARQIAFQNPKNTLGVLAKVRIGDLYRLLERYPEAIEQYRSVEKGVKDESEGRRLPAEDRANAITIEDLLAKGHRDEAAQKLLAWESRRPMAKFESDFLLLRARMLMDFGRWQEALQELDSLLKVQPESPRQIDIDFHRARCLFESGEPGRQEEARAIWAGIAKSYPKHEFARESERMSREK